MRTLDFQARPHPKLSSLTSRSARTPSGSFQQLESLLLLLLLLVQLPSSSLRDLSGPFPYRLTSCGSPLGSSDPPLGSCPFSFSRSCSCLLLASLRLWRWVSRYLDSLCLLSALPNLFSQTSSSARKPTGFYHSLLAHFYSSWCHLLASVYFRFGNSLSFFDITYLLATISVASS